jgi:SAM-dependent methyltransferase
MSTSTSLDYTGLGAVAWDLFSSGDPGQDQAYFQGLIEQRPGPALDVGCGTGRLLVPYLKAGLEVEGVDPSADMLAICRRRASEQGLESVLYQQTIQTLDLPRRYQTIFIPCGTIQLVMEYEEVFEALRRCYGLLEPGGYFILTLYNRWVELQSEKSGEWKHRARKALPDGTEIEKDAQVGGSNLIEQTLQVKVRYRRFQGEQLIEEQVVDAPERWYFKHEMLLMLERTGFKPIRVTGNYTDADFSDEHYVAAFIAIR